MNLKKCLATAALGCAILTGGSLSASAADYNYDASSFDYGIYVGGGNGSTFKLGGTASFVGSQKAYTSGNATGVIYQIRTTSGSTVSGYATTKYGAGSVDTGKDLDGLSGNHKAYMRNAYNEATPQTAKGKFYY